MDREQKVQTLLAEVTRLIMEIEHRVPAETCEVDELKKLVKELRDGGE